MTIQIQKVPCAAPHSMVRPCPLCGALTAKVSLILDKHTPEGEPYQVVTCTECELLYTRPEPTPQELNSLYSEEFYGASREPKLLSWDSLRLVLHRLVLSHRQKALLARKPGRVLDIGCGDGDFLAHLKARGWETYGVEFSDAGCKLARAKGITVHQGELSAAHFPEGFFDVVTIWHVLEHLPAPTTELAEVQRILSDDGLLAIEVPNSGSLTFKLCRERWWPLDIPRHLQHFTPLTLQKLLQQVGFSPVYRQDFHLVDFTMAFVSFMERLGVLGRRRGDHYFVSDFRKAGLLTKMLFLATGSVVATLSLPYSLAATLCTGQSEAVTITFRKAGTA
jgi:SAM-dependent methyltransferase